MKTKKLKKIIEALLNMSDPKGYDPNFEYNEAFENYFVLFFHFPINETIKKPIKKKTKKQFGLKWRELKLLSEYTDSSLEAYHDMARDLIRFLRDNGYNVNCKLTVTKKR